MEDNSEVGDTTLDRLELLLLEQHKQSAMILSTLNTHKQETKAAH